MSKPNGLPRWAVIVLVVCGIALIAGLSLYDYLKNRAEVDSLDENVIASKLNAGDYSVIGSQFDTENGYFVWHEDTGEVERADRSAIRFVSGRVMDGYCLITVVTDSGYGILVNYSETVYEDLNCIDVLAQTGRPIFISSGIELDFIEYTVYLKFGDACFISGDKAYAYRSGGREETSDRSFKKLFFSDALTDGSIALLSEFPYAEDIMFSDEGNFAFDGGAIWTKDRSALCYVMPYCEKIICYPSTSILKEGCMKNAVNICEISIPYVGKSISYLFSGAPSALKKITFTSALYDTVAEDTFYDCLFVEEITLPKQIKAVEDGAFAPCPNLKKIYCVEGTYISKKDLSAQVIYG